MSVQGHHYLLISS